MASTSASPDGKDKSNPVECHACTQVGVPGFHSSRCDSANVHRPQWEANAGSSLVPIANRADGTGSWTSTIRHVAGRVLDPRSDKVKRWNRTTVLARTMSLAVDPLFFYALSVDRRGLPCLYMDGSLAAVTTLVRTSVDFVHVWHIWLQFRVAYVSRESLVVGCGKLVWDTRVISKRYLRSMRGLWLDVFVILPIPQVVFWFLAPGLIHEDRIRATIALILLTFLFQYIPKVYHCIYLIRKKQKVTGYIFGSIWWGFGLNLLAYFVASHVAGSCWYVLAIQRLASCLNRQYCRNQNPCGLKPCPLGVCFSFLQRSKSGENSCYGNLEHMWTKPMCFDVHGPFRYGIYKRGLPVISSDSIVVKLLYPVHWGLMSLSTFGNTLEPTSHWLEVIFSICNVLGGLLLFTLLIGNIQLLLHTVMATKKQIQLRCRDMEWWMSRRQLPSILRQRVRFFEYERLAAMRGEDEMELIEHLPDGLRRDIKRYLCIDLIKKVPIFHGLDDLILDNICDRVKPLVFSKDEKIIREGDPVQRIVFIVSGKVKSSQNLSQGVVATSILDPGGFFGDELLSWGLRRPFIERLPASSATFVCTECTDAFGLDAKHLRYVTDHFRYTFANEKLKRTARYYSSNWRTWAAVNVQLAWRRYKERAREPLDRVIESSGDERKLRQYAAMFMSIRPHDHLE